jgi:D-alanyl-lipoteichoic acid acyltransferase DltB (MBOAT superfamily)
VFAVTCFAWVFFRAANVQDAFHIVSTVFSNPGNTIHIGDKGIFAFSVFGIIILIAVEFMNEYYPEVNLLNHRFAPVRYATILIMLIIIISLGVFDGSQFIYFQF